jgi:hypothetical protein
MSWSGPRPLSALLVVGRSGKAPAGRVVVAVVEANPRGEAISEERTPGLVGVGGEGADKLSLTEVTDPDAIVWGVGVASVGGHSQC